MNAPYPDDATIELILAATLAAIHSGKIPLPEDVPQIAALRAHVAELEARARDHAEAVVIAHGVGAASRNGEVRELTAACKGAEDNLWQMEAERNARAAERADALRQCKEAEASLWNSQRLKDNYSSELKVVIGERDAAKALLAYAQIYVRGVIEENAANWGERLMHKQQPAIDCDAAITAFLEGQK